jgi:hypothetical protein
VKKGWHDPSHFQRSPIGLKCYKWERFEVLGRQGRAAVTVGSNADLDNAVVDYFTGLILNYELEVLLAGRLACGFRCRMFRRRERIAVFTADSTH